jgi:uncharacterized repeat protein (TIGR02543 family)
VTLILGLSSGYYDASLVFAADSNVVDFNANGGKGLHTDSKNISVGAKYGKMPEPYRVGYLFDGWYVTPDGDTMITAGSIRSDEDPGTLYAHWQKASSVINLEIKKWNVKSKVTVSHDLSLMSTTSYLSKQYSKNKYSFSKYRANWVRLYYNKGYSAPLHAKIGTATLAKPAPANILTPVIVDKYIPGRDEMEEKLIRVSNGHSLWAISDAEEEFRDRFGNTNITKYWLVGYKGDKTVDIYVEFDIKILNKGKKIANTTYKGTPKKFRYGEKYKTRSKPSVIFKNRSTTNYLENGNAIENTRTKELGFGKSFDGYTFYTSIPIYEDNPNIYYQNAYKEKQFGIWGVPLDVSVQVSIKNKKLSYGGSIDKKNPIYKAAKKKIGKHSPSCSQTVLQVLKESKAGETIFNLPPDQARTGDITLEPDHTAIYIGGGQTINGSITSHKVFLLNGICRDSAYVMRPISNVFRYR